MELLPLKNAPSDIGGSALTYPSRNSNILHFFSKSRIFRHTVLPDDIKMFLKNFNQHVLRLQFLVQINDCYTSKFYVTPIKIFFI